jgi:hypothetical protein
MRSGGRLQLDSLPTFVRIRTPDIVEAIVEGRADDRVMLKVLEGTLPVDWEEQRGILKID